jgi:hypothetical protein
MVALHSSKMAAIAPVNAKFCHLNATIFICVNHAPLLLDKKFHKKIKYSILAADL